MFHSFHISLSQYFTMSLINFFHISRCPRLTVSMFRCVHISSHLCFAMSIFDSIYGSLRLCFTVFLAVSPFSCLTVSISVSSRPYFAVYMLYCAHMAMYCLAPVSLCRGFTMCMFHRVHISCFTVPIFPVSVFHLVHVSLCFHSGYG